MISSPPEKKRASLYTLGCRLNQSETWNIRERLDETGYTLVPFGEEADLGIINTCTVTREADAKCRQAIRRFIRKNPGAFTAVIGCYSQMGAKAIADIPGVDLIIGNQEKLRVLDYVGEGKNERPVIIRERIEKTDFRIPFSGGTPFRKRPNLKIQEGCDFICSFCIIPFARGRARSREFSDVMKEAREMGNRGVKEIVLTGVNIGTYDNCGRDIVSLIDALNSIPTIHRIRISSIEPTTAPVSLFSRMRDPAHGLLPYLHIPLQSGSDLILEKMRRRYSVSEFMGFIKAAAGEVPELCIGTDVMVGFPGEGEAEFDDTVKVFREGPFAYCHVFPYSEREGTLAAKRADPVPVPVRHRRGARLRRLSSHRRFDYYERFLGSTMEVLFENRKEDYWPGYTGNYIRVLCRSEEMLANRRAEVRLERLSADFAEGSIVKLIDEPASP